MLQAHTAAHLLLLSALLLAGCDKKGADGAAPAAQVGQLRVAVENVVGTEPLELGSRSYAGPAGQSFTVTAFNYYLSNFKLHRADGSAYAVPESYFLVREQQPGSSRPTGKSFVLDSIPVGSYTGLSFLVGVDEERNSDGAQTGALDPALGMFWTWSQGYVFLAMEGTSPQSGDLSSHLLSFHVGGVRPPNTLREVAPPLPSGVSIRIAGSRPPELRLRTNLLRLFEGPSPVLFASDYAAIGGAEANRIASNYSGSPARNIVGTNSMFTVAEVRAE